MLQVFRGTSYEEHRMKGWGDRVEFSCDLFGILLNEKFVISSPFIYSVIFIPVHTPDNHSYSGCNPKYEICWELGVLLAGCMSL